MDFLKRVPNPTQDQWKQHDYWKHVLPHMRKIYKGICSYSALWISPATGTHSIDHFKPKSSNPRLAYEWGNYRFVSLRYNTLKGTKEILDPFKLKPGWFLMDFPSLKVKPNPELSNKDADAVRNTVSVLKLNTDPRYKEHCQDYVMEYCNGGIAFCHLEKKAPFISFELKRQGLAERETLAQVMKYPKPKKKK